MFQGPGKIKERETGVEVLRLQVTDKDVRGSKGWKAKYTIYGDKKEQFKIETDPVTNEGILTVVKVRKWLTFCFVCVSQPAQRLSQCCWFELVVMLNHTEKMF